MYTVHFILVVVCTLGTTIPIKVENVSSAPKTCHAVLHSEVETPIPPLGSPQSALCQCRLILPALEFI